MARAIIELREDIRFEDGTWVPTDERTAELVRALCGGCSAPRPLFSRGAHALDVEHVALCDGARRDGDDPGQVPDLNRFYVVDGDAASLARLPLVAGVVEVVPLDAPSPVPGAPAGARVVGRPSGDLLADAIDAAAATLGQGDALAVPWPLTDPGSRAAVACAARRGVRIFAPDGEVRAGRRAAPARRLRPRLQVTLDSITLVEGGDRRGTSELYVEGWIDDGVRHRFRHPEKGAVRGVRRGVAQAMDATLYDAMPLSDTLIVHLELWEEDLGRHSLIDPDDLLGVHERRFAAGERWGEGRHEGVRVATEGGSGVLCYSIRVAPA